GPALTTTAGPSSPRRPIARTDTASISASSGNAITCAPSVARTNCGRHVPSRCRSCTSHQVTAVESPAATVTCNVPLVSRCGPDTTGAVGTCDPSHVNGGTNAGVL